MSIYTKVKAKCSNCEAVVSFDVIDSVNVTRELTVPGIRDAILNRTFQAEQCPGCGETFRASPEFTYVDFNRGEFFGVWPADHVSEYDKCAEFTLKAYERAYGSEASPVAKNLGKDLNQIRVLFGWVNLNEKLIAGDAGIDDLTLELAKLAIIRAGDVFMDETHQELRLVAVDDEYGLAFGWFPLGSEKMTEGLTLPKDILGEITLDPESWKDLRSSLEDGIFVDYRKLLLVEEPA